MHLWWEVLTGAKYFCPDEYCRRRVLCLDEYSPWMSIFMPRQVFPFALYWKQNIILSLKYSSRVSNQILLSVLLLFYLLLVKFLWLDHKSITNFNLKLIPCLYVKYKYVTTKLLFYIFYYLLYNILHSKCIIRYLHLSGVFWQLWLLQSSVVISKKLLWLYTSLHSHSHWLTKLPFRPHHHLVCSGQLSKALLISNNCC